MTVIALVTWACLTAAQTAPDQLPWLKGFEGTRVVQNPRGAEADIAVTIVREGSLLVLKAVSGGREIVTRYDLSGADLTNKNVTGTSVFRTRIEGQKLVTQIWTNEAVGPPRAIETRYMESADLMVTELSKTAGEPPFNRTVLQRKKG